MAATAQDAIAVAAMRHPDIVVLDLGPSDVDVVRVIRAMKAAPDATLVVAHPGMPRRDANTRAAGCDAFVLKPSLDAIMAIIEALDPKRVASNGAIH